MKSGTKAWFDLAIGGSWVLVFALSDLGCSSCNAIGCPSPTHVEFEPALTEPGQHRLVIEAVGNDYRVVCAFDPSDSSDDVACNTDFSATLHTVERSGVRAVTSIRISDPNVMSFSSEGLRLRLELEGTELRSEQARPRYAPRPIENACDNCSEAHVAL